MREVFGEILLVVSTVEARLSRGLCVDCCLCTARKVNYEILHDFVLKQ
ncbi:hypothetical protein SAMN02910371_02748 [Butyrivibrio sp. INlla14]|nr:hypothetical protein SAMN02910371_02748 [Butyrivibrio sp. INlla14]